MPAPSINSAPAQGSNLTATDYLVTYYALTNHVLGTGQFGNVKLATCRRTGENVAVKTIDKNILTRNCRRALNNEVRILKQLDHPGICKLLDVFEDNKRMHMVLNLCGDGDLFDRCYEHGPFSECQARTTMKSLLEAVAHLHERGITHRDIKPENLACFNDSGEVILLDFGLSHQHEDHFTDHHTPAEKKSQRPTLSRMNSRVGTPNYMSPEILDTDRTYDNATDLWSSGVVMYILLAGFFPFDGKNNNDIFRSILTKGKQNQIDFSDQNFKCVSSEAKDLIRALMAADPNMRPSAAEALRFPFFHCGTVETETAEGEADAETATQCTRHRADQKGLLLRPITSSSGSDTECEWEEDITYIYSSTSRECGHGTDVCWQAKFENTSNPPCE